MIARGTPKKGEFFVATTEFARDRPGRNAAKRVLDRKSTSAINAMRRPRSRAR
jgi:hypothetical protein